jgi:hypothetical protein
VFAFSIYLLAGGACALLFPGLLLDLIQQPRGIAPWLRALGVALCVLGLFYYQGARHELVPFFRATVVGRAFVFLSLLAVVVWTEAPLALALVGTIDGLGAVWTGLALRRTRG